MIKQEITIACTMIQTTQNKSLLIEVPALSVPPSLRSGEHFAGAIKKLFERTNKARLERKLERFLKRAREAEVRQNYFRATRSFALALLCEGRLRDDVTDAYGYVRHAMPVY
jgi:hypothetical protein